MSDAFVGLLLNICLSFATITWWNAFLYEWMYEWNEEQAASL
jgi:hypothetical protein